MKDHFAIRAEEYDQTGYRLNYVDAMARSIRETVGLEPKMRIVDFGAGTGLLSERIAPFVEEIIAIDVSPSMIEKLRGKQEGFPCHLEIRQMDLCAEPFGEDPVDGIISSMTLHHIDDPVTLFRIFHRMLKPGGFLALCDIDTEDGSFHTIDTGVKHYGFEREHIREWAESAGFVDVKVSDSTVIVKEHGEFPAFLLSGYQSEKCSSNDE